jgi:hypothetical protein
MHVLDSMVCSIMTEYPLYGYSIKFLKKTKKSNIEHLQNFPQNLDRHSYSKDILIKYKMYYASPYFERYDYYKDGDEIYGNGRKLVCENGMTVPYIRKKTFIIR